MTNLRLAVLISGAGSTLQNLIQGQAAGRLPVDFRLVVSSSRLAGGLQYAHEASIPVEVVSRRDFPHAQAHSDRLFALCREREVQLVVMGGYVEHLLIPADFENRVVNIHPSLIPAFSGKGFYGKRIHEAALEYGVKVAGCTVHFVDNDYDHGPIIAQRSCPVFEQDTAESLRRRVGELECHLYPEVIAAIACGRVKVSGRRVSMRVAPQQDAV
ncbi:MAG: phosphoribosylglycinamide formyltransferase [Planctomycetales bacterium]|nr:phosphoribosylglycinamide formyltransferase [Planctomycetales bacterium]